MPTGGKARRFTILALVTAAGALYPQALFACWEICTSTFGYIFEANQTYYELQSCSQTWPEGSNEPHTVCHYKNLFRNVE